MKIAIISDTHLGMRRLGFHSEGVNLIESDNYKAIRHATLEIQKSKADVVIHGGDIFENDNPNSHATIEFLNLANAFEKIPSYWVSGNHDNGKLLESLNKVIKSEIFFKWGYETKTVGEWTFFFMPHLDPVVLNGKRDWTKEYELYSRIGIHAANLEKTILVTHGILKSEATAYHIDLSGYNGSNVIPDKMLENFRYCIIGHNHTPSIRNINGCKVIVPGSTVPDLFKTGLQHGLGALFLDPETGEMERSSFIPRDIKKLVYTGSEDLLELIIQGGIYLITDSSPDGLTAELLQQMRDSALLVTIEREAPDYTKISTATVLPGLIEYSLAWEEEMPGISEYIREDHKAV